MYSLDLRKAAKQRGGIWGVTFRVWAPHAEKAYVTGTFNEWSGTATPLSYEVNGYWSADVSEAKAGDEYRYLIHGLEGCVSRIDLFARKVTNSVGNGVIYKILEREPDSLDGPLATAIEWTQQENPNGVLVRIAHPLGISFSGA
jgi:1,4-alpha-glucan branching enzyme